MTHLVRQHFTGFLGQFPFSHVEEDTEHDPADDALIFSPATSGDPMHLTAMQNAEVDLVGAKFFTGCSESGPNPIQVFGMDTGGQVLERDRLAAGNVPQAARPFIHGNSVGIDIPRPECDSGGICGNSKSVRIPHRWRRVPR